MEALCEEWREGEGIGNEREATNMWLMHVGNRKWVGWSLIETQ